MHIRNKIYQKYYTFCLLIFDYYSLSLLVNRNVKYVSPPGRFLAVHFQGKPTYCVTYPV
jgi:hypothetical protein